MLVRRTAPRVPRSCVQCWQATLWTARCGSGISARRARASCSEKYSQDPVCPLPSGGDGVEAECSSPRGWTPADTTCCLSAHLPAARGAFAVEAWTVAFSPDGTHIAAGTQVATRPHSTRRRPAHACARVHVHACLSAVVCLSLPHCLPADRLHQRLGRLQRPARLPASVPSILIPSFVPSILIPSRPTPNPAVRRPRG